MESDSSDILGQKTMPVARMSNSQRSSFSTTKLAFYGVALLVSYAVGQRLWKRFLLWRERSYKLATRRRHGIPDDDLRPFNVAYTEAVMRTREEESKKYATTRPAVPQRESIDLGEAVYNQNLRQRPIAHTNEPNPRATVGPVPGGYSSRYNDSLPQPARSHHDHHTDGPAYAPSASSSRRLSRHSARLVIGESTSDAEAKKRGWIVEEDEEHEAKKTRVEGDELIDGDDDAEFDEAAPRRGSKRGIREDEDVDEGKVSSKSRGKRARKVSGRHSYQVDHTMDIDDDDEEMDDITDLKPISRGKKRDRAEAGSTFGADDDDSGAEHEDDSKLRRRRRKRRTVAKRKSEASYLLNKKRQRDVDEDVSEDSEGSSPSKRSSNTRKRGKRSSANRRDYERQRSDVSMDESLTSNRSKHRDIGDEWENNGVRWKIGLNGQKLRLALVKKARQRFMMPKDSQHPDREANMQICVETWLSDEEYQQAKADHALAWQESPRHDGERLFLDTSNGIPFPQHVPGKNLLWSTSATSTPTISPASHSPSEGTPEIYQPRVSHSSYRHSLGGSTGLPGSPFGNTGMPTVKRISSTSRALSMSGSLNGLTPFAGSLNGHESPAPGLSDSTIASPRSPGPKVFSKWEKQELEAKAIMKVREANKKKEMEREAKLKAEKDAKEKVEKEKALSAENARLEREKAEKDRLDRERAEKESKQREETSAKASATSVPNITVVPPPGTFNGTGGGAVPNTFFNPPKPAELTPTPTAAPSTTNFFSKSAEPPKPAPSTFSFGSTPSAAPTPAAQPTTSPFSLPPPPTPIAEKKETTPATTATPASGPALFSHMGPPPQPTQPSEQSKPNPLFSFPKANASSTTTSTPGASFSAANPVKFGFPTSGGSSSNATSTPATAPGSSLSGALGGPADSKANVAAAPPLFNFKAPTTSSQPAGAFPGTGTGAAANPSFGFGNKPPAFSSTTTNGTKEAAKPAFGTTTTAFGTATKSTPFGQENNTPSPFGATTLGSAFGQPTNGTTTSAFGGASASIAPSPFGASSTPNPFATNNAKPEAKTTFSFGPSTSSSTPAATSGSTFSFGATKSATPAPASASAFSFGGSSGAAVTSTKPSPFGAPASTTSNSLFGNAATNTTTTPATSTPAPVFSFGTPAK
ncbi:hypothetical protein CPB83DRAFT_878985 [Crepidotus variabilis]|uniref:Uncharacterized protein n=1 Tax=Crepidotus variabilis TaxID=179855 RepID=A0A9P6ETB6_9AGAR|nr:hypothetical protein CPB83DRAFT_878985 [Crepidotus variabilis]